MNPLLLALALTLSACGAAAVPERSAPPAPIAASVDRVAAERAIGATLDDFHDAAAKADEARYFGHFAKGGVFLGTDATERWDVAAFRAYAHPHFAKGKAWTMRATRRAITVADDGTTAWFDEDLATERLGPARGSGVLVVEGGGWKVAQYNLTITVPNERFADARAAIDAPPFDDRFKAAYAKATKLASDGDLFAATHALDAIVDEAATRNAEAAFWLHNELTWLRWAQGDLAGALREVDGAHAMDVDARTRLHELWDRAYLLRETAKDGAAVGRAILAREAYEKAAAPQHDDDGMNVLAAFFAVRARDAKGALAAAKKVDEAKDADLQDLYVLALAYDLGGDRPKGDALRARIRAGNDDLMKPLIVRQIGADAAAKKGRAATK